MKEFNDIWYDVSVNTRAGLKFLPPKEKFTLGPPPLPLHLDELHLL